MFYEPPHQLLKDSRFWASMYVVLGSVVFFVMPVEHFLFSMAGGKLIERIRSSTFKSVVHQEIKWFDDPKNSRLLFFFLPSLICVIKNACVFILMQINLCKQKLQPVILFSLHVVDQLAHGYLQTL